MVHVMSKTTWDKLTPEQQKIVKEESKRAGQWFRDRMVEEEGELIQKLKDKGMQVTQPDIAKFRSAMQPAYDRIADYAGKENVTKFLKMVNDAR
jgi:TRAP-type C4-dicarboxylate transport system substrate-binding protein